MAGSGGPSQLMANWRTKLSNTVKNVTAALDPHEKEVASLVDRATSDRLTAPDWSLNLELVDLVNSDPLENADKVLRSLRRAFLKPNTQVQLLALTALETCVKSCVPYFFEQLIQSELWTEMMRAGDPMRRWDFEVRDRVLCLIEDFGRGLPLPAYRAAYESLVDRGVDFPVRPPPDDSAPYYTPPVLPQRVVQQAPPPGAAAVGGVGSGLSPEDRAAIAAAMAELEAQAQQSQPQGVPGAQTAYAPGHAHAQQQPGHPQQQQGPAVQQEQQQQQPAAEPVDVEATLRVAANSAGLLGEMLAPLQAEGADPAGVRDTFIADLADQCVRYQSVLQDAILRSQNEEQLSAALALNDELQQRLATYQQLLEKAGPAPGVPVTGGLPTSTVPGGNALAGAGAYSHAAGANFTLDDDEGDDDLSLHTRRAPASHAPASTGAPTSTQTPAADLIALGEPLPPAGRASAGSTDAAPVGPTATSDPVPVGAAGGASVIGQERRPTEVLVEEMDRIVLRSEEDNVQQPKQ